MTEEFQVLKGTNQREEREHETGKLEYNEEKQENIEQTR